MMAVLLYILSTNNSIVTTWIHEEAIDEVLCLLIRILHVVNFFSVDLATKGRGRFGWLDWLTLPQSIQFDQISSLFFIHELTSFQSI